MNLYEKIIAIMEEVKHLQKDSNVSTGKSGSYKAVSEEKVTSTVRQSLIKHKVVIFPIERNFKTTPREYKNQYGSDAISYFTETNSKYKIVNAENPDEFEIIVSGGHGIDSQDKGVGKALTYDYKYLLLRTFAISTGLDPDVIENGNDDKPEKKELKKTKPSINFLRGELPELLKEAVGNSVKGYETNENVVALVKKHLGTAKVGDCKDQDKLHKFYNKVECELKREMIEVLLGQMGLDQEKREKFYYDNLDKPYEEVYDIEVLEDLEKKARSLK